EPHLRGFAPAAKEGKVGAPLEETGCEKFGLDALVPLQRIAAPNVDRVVRADRSPIAGAESEPATRVRALKERMEAQSTSRHDLLGAAQLLFSFVRHVRADARGFLCLRLLDGFGACGGFLGLGRSGRGGEHDHDGQRSYHRRGSQHRYFTVSIETSTASVQV